MNANNLFLNNSYGAAAPFPTSLHLPLIILESSSTEDKETLLRPGCFTELQNLIFSITNFLPRVGSWSIY